MSTLTEIEDAIRRLDSGDRKALLEWLEEESEAEWDRPIEQDAAAGKPDRFAERAIAAHRAGLTREPGDTSSMPIS